jgi:hypothetical protein
MFCEAKREEQKHAFFDVLQKDLRSQIFYEWKDWKLHS